MKESRKIILYFFIVSCVVLAIRWIDLWVVDKIIPTNGYWQPMTYADSFESYRDFVLVITGIVTIIVAILGFGSYISFKQFKEKENELTKKLEGEKEEFASQRKKLEMFLLIEEARIVKDSDEKGSMAAIKAYDKAEKNHDEFALLYVLKGEEYYLMGTKHIQDARVSFEKAIDVEKPGSARAWYGLGQATYKAALDIVGDSGDKNLELDIDKVKEFCLKSTFHTDNDTDMLKEAIICMNNAMKYGYDNELVLFEIGRIYEALGEDAKSLIKYRKAYSNNEGNLTAGLYYCLAWIRVHIDCLKFDGYKEVISILERIGNLGVYNSKMAYALLWFFYSKVDENEKATDVYGKTNHYEIQELFVQE